MTWQHKYSGRDEESVKKQRLNLKIGRKRQIKRSKLSISSKSLQEANIIDFATDPEFLGLSFKERPVQEILLRTLYNLPLSGKQKKILKQVSPGYRTNGELLEAIWVLGARSGKSLLASIIALYEATRQKWQQYLSKGESAYITIVATRQKQAEQIIGANCARLIENSPGLRNLIEGIYSTELILKNGMKIISLPASSTAGRGLPIAAFILDECGHYYTEGIKADANIYNSLRPRMAQFPGAKVILISTPSAKQGLLWQFFKEGFDIPGRFTAQAATTLMNPVISEEFIERERKRDPDYCTREFDAIFAERTQNFFPEELLDSCFTLFESTGYKSGSCYACGIDQSGLSGRDRFAVAIAHKQGNVSVVDTVRAWETKEIDKILSGTKDLKKEYNFHKVSIDKYASGWVAGNLKKLGLEVEIRPPLPQIYTNLKSLMLARRVELPEGSDLRKALKNTQSYYSKTNTLSIAHERSSTGHGDAADAAATAIYITSSKISYNGGIKVNVSRKKVGLNPSELLSGKPKRKDRDLIDGHWREEQPGGYTRTAILDKEQGGGEEENG